MSASQPIPLLYSGEAGNYFGTEEEKFPEDVHSDILEVDRLLASQNINYLGKLTCSQFDRVEIYAYGTSDRRISVSVMALESGLGGIDCVCKFADESFLTTTTTKIIPDAYDEQQLFRVSFPQLNVVELWQQHENYVRDFESEHGAVQAIFHDLLAIAKLVDEYTIRQQANFGHGFLQWATGLVETQISQMMGDDSALEDDDNDLEEENEENFEHYETTESPLIRAILQDDLTRVETLLAAGVEVNPSAWDDPTPLVAAVQRGNPAMIQTLIAAAAKLDRLDMFVNARPMGMAIKQNRPDLVKLLLDAGASPEGGDLEETGLAIAIWRDSLPILEMLLEAGADPNSGMEDDYRVIMQAALYGRLEMVKLLVERGADVSWSQGETAIMSAARGGHQDIYNYLYPLVDEETRRYADKYGQKEIAKAIKRKARAADKLTEKLAEAALYGKLTKVRQLLAEGADPNAIAKSGKTPLICAAMYGHKDVIEALLDAGADPNLCGDEDFDESQTPLMYIASSFLASNRAEVIKFLVDRGADPDIQNNKGETSLMLARKNADSVKALIEVGADLNIRDNYGNTAMMQGTWSIQKLLRQAGASKEGLNDVALVDVARQGDLTKLEALLQAGANVNYNDGSALVNAAGEGNLAIVDRLIQAGANVNLGWKTGFTPIARAAYEGYLDIIERLLDAGADPFQRTHDDEFLDALDYARLGQAEGQYKGKDHAAIIELLSQRQPSS